MAIIIKANCMPKMAKCEKGICNLQNGHKTTIKLHKI